MCSSSINTRGSEEKKDVSPAADPFPPHFCGVHVEVILTDGEKAGVSSCPCRLSRPPRSAPGLHICILTSELGASEDSTVADKQRMTHRCEHGVSDLPVLHLRFPGSENEPQQLNPEDETHL